MTARPAALAALSLCLVAIVVAGTPAVFDTTTLVVSDADGTELATFQLEEGDEVAIEYTHSVERTLVTDVYRVSDGALVDDRMLFSSFGAGLPSTAEVEVAGDRYVYYPPERRYEHLSVSTGPVADHDLVVDGERHDLAALADNGTVRLRIDTTPRLIHAI